MLGKALRIKLVCFASVCCAILGISFFPQKAVAAVLTENFEAVPFSQWESGWLKTNSNLENFYVTLGSNPDERGNNPDGLWISDGIYDGPAIILFNSLFAASLTSLDSM